MENLGYKEGSTKPKAPAGKRRMSRARASIVENEALPLSLTPRYFIFNSRMVTQSTATRFKSHAILNPETPKNSFSTTDPDLRA